MLRTQNSAQINIKIGVRDLTLQQFTQSPSPRRPLPMISLAYCGNEGGVWGNLRVYKN